MLVAGVPYTWRRDQRVVEMVTERIRPQFEVHEVPQEQRSKRTVAVPKFTTKPSKDGKSVKRQVGFEYKELDDDRPQFDVYFPHGHSIRVIGKTEMVRLGFANKPGLVDMETGEIVPQHDISLRDYVERSTRQRMPL